MARHEQADQIAIVLQRAYPNGLDQDELAAQSGLTTDELRGAIASLEEGGEVVRDGDEWCWRDPDERPPAAEDEQPPADEDEQPEPEFHVEPLAAGGATNRLVLEVIGNFPPGRAASDESTIKQAEAIAEQVQNVLGSAMGSFGAAVFVRRLEAFDQPRVLLDAREEAPPS